MTPTHPTAVKSGPGSDHAERDAPTRTRTQVALAAPARRVVGADATGAIPSKPSLVTGLITCLVVTLLPIIIAFDLGAKDLYAPAVAIAYLLQIGCLTGVMIAHRAAPTPGWVLVATTLAASQTITLTSTSITLGMFEARDLVSAFAKCAGILIFAGCASQIGIRPPHLDAILRAFLMISVVAILYNILVNIGRFSEILTVSSSYQLVFRAFFANRNQFGFFLFLGLFAHMLLMRDQVLRTRNWVLLFLQLGSLILTMSRGSIGASLVFLLTLIFLRFRSKIVLLLTLTLTGSIGLLALWDTTVGAMIARDFIRADVGLSGRDQVWAIGLSIWSSNNPLFGTGSFSALNLAHNAGMLQDEFHSFFIETLNGGGLAELAIIFSIASLSLARMRRSALGKACGGTYSAGAAGLLILGAVESVTLFTIGFVGTIFTIFFITLPLVVGNSSDQESGTVATQSS